MARKILLADDSVTAQNMGRKILADAGYEVITVNNGSAALKKIAEQKPDLIVLDVYMPGYSGLEVCQRLKEAQETARVPVLLTVGKLEPFKPEEAKRARADGFIVKPFEASELLSALSKLEDKIVPRPEASKPGRFARVTAAIEEGRYDKTVAVDEDSGWKNRIAFPSKKKEKVAPDDGDDSAIYNTMNKDLRTVVEHPREAKSEEARFDLGALAPEGLPKDVTPEEIAALAAAAAHVKGKIEENKLESEATTEQKAEAAQPTAERPQEVTAAQPPVVTFAEQNSAEKIAAPAEKSSEAPQEAASIAAPSPADVTAAISGLEPEAGASRGAGSANGSWSHGATDQTADEPVTMAVAAGAESAPVISRWKAVSVALAPEEAALSLEHEMQKAYAAFAAAETGHAGLSAATPEPPPVPAAVAPTIETSSPTEAAAPESVIPATPAPEAAQTLSAVASAATDAISAAVKELEAVAASYVELRTPAPAEPEAAPVEVVKAEAASSLTPEAPQTVTTTTEETSIAPVEPETPKLETAQPEPPQTGTEEPNQQKNEDSKSEAPAPVAAAEPEDASGKKLETLETTPALVSEVPAEPTPVSHVSETPSNTEDPAKGESEVAETTAAAWASWHRIRESGNSNAPLAEHEPRELEQEASAPEDAAARAVAAGAEKAPQDTPADSPSDAEGIASIVDSVLADLRPKIYEEISRKMGKKK